MTLEPGDVILTGTPAGDATLAPGQTIETEVSGVGVLRNRVESLAVEGPGGGVPFPPEGGKGTEGMRG
jgi:hypothetical protein